ncbi:MAG: dihydropteroate synthase [Thioalkalivibrionaceae bacterium]
MIGRDTKSFESELLAVSEASPLVMGVVNVTPDSFSDGGRYFSPQDRHRAAIDHGLRLIEAGATWIDVGGESTRPGAIAVSLADERDRVLPVVKGLREAGVERISVDSRKPALMREALAVGATMLNDVSGFSDPQAIEAAADANASVCVMHMQGVPNTMQQAPSYRDVVAEVEAFLLERADALEASGVARTRIWLDPGFGFGKTLEHNLALFANLPRLAAHGYPLLIGVSRKSMIAALIGRGPDEVPPADRVAGSVAATLLAVDAGVRMVRVHDVRETVDALRVRARLRAQRVHGPTAW